MSDDINYKFTLLDRAGVTHYLIHHNKIEAYKIAKNKADERTTASINTMAQNYFRSKKTNALIALITNDIKNKFESIAERLELKDTNYKDSHITNNVGIQDIDKVAEIDKASAIRMIEKVLNNNRTDLKTIKELTPQLIKLKDWDKERINDKTNITTFQLPKYQ